MTAKPLGEIRLWPGDHLSALWWLGLLYRRPSRFSDAVEALGRWRGGLAGLALYVHSWPYVLALGLAGRLAVAAAVDVPWNAEWIFDGLREVVVWIVLGIGGGIVFGIVVGIVVGIVFGIVGGIGVGIGVGIVVGTGEGVAAAGAFCACYFPLLLRLYYQPAHLLFVWPRERPEWYHRHPVTWDDVCLLPFRGLDRLLAAYHAAEPARGEREIDRLIDSYPDQRHQALRARARVVAREAGRAELTQIGAAVERLPAGDKGFLAQTGIVREGAARIAQLQARFHSIERPVFREPTARQILDEIERFRGRAGGLREPLRSEFRAAALAWKALAEAQLEQVRSAVGREPVKQVFRAGDPVNSGQEAFVPRVNVIGRLEQQVMLATGCPGVILYGRRRRGKSSVLRNLTGLGLLPVNVRSATVSLQDPRAFTSVEHLVGQVGAAIGPEAAGEVAPRTLAEFFAMLGRANERLAARGERLILALDEYENIDLKIGEGVFPEDLLATIRESIQTHRSITWLFAGSHRVEDLPNARWTSYLVSARMIEVPNFTPAETRALLTEPLKHSREWARDSPDRPRFEDSFWGVGGIERIQRETDGWPHLVQLIAETCVDLMNEGEDRRVTAELMEAALDEAVVRGHTALYELMRGESGVAGEWEYLEGFREREGQAAPVDGAVRRSLLRREVAGGEGEVWRLRVPLMGRWLRRQG